MWDVLVVEDDVDARRLVEAVLGEAFHLRFAESVAQALERVAERVPDLALLDVNLPDGDGFQVCSELQARERTRGVPVIFLTSRIDTRDKVVAFTLGADDYIEKPFDPDELLARVQGRLRKRRERAERGEVLVRGPLRIDVDRFRVCVREGENERELELTPNEFRLLHHLATRPGRPVTRRELLDAVWNGTTVSERTVDTHLSNLRKKLGAAGDCVEAVRGVGYRFADEESAPVSPGRGDARLA